MFTFRNLFQVFYETPDPTAVAGGGGAGNPAPGTPQQGQGQTPEGGPAGARQYFPNVPDEQWAIMEPHVSQFEGYVTQLQQQVAPLKALTDAGYTPERLQGLVNFEHRFQTNPLDVWLEMGQALQSAPEQGGQPALHPDVDLEYLAAIARGQDPDAGSVPGTQPGADPAAGQGDPQALQIIQQLQQEVQSLKQELTQDRTQRQQSVQDQLYDRRLGQMRDSLKTAGWPEELLTDEQLGAQVIIHRGDFQAAAKSLIDTRSGLLKGLSQQRNENTPPPTNLPNGVPSTPSREVPNRQKGDSWAGATRNAEARLKRANQPG